MTAAGPSGGEHLSAVDRLQPALLIGSIGIGLVLGRLAPAVAQHLGSGVELGVFGLIYLVLRNVDPGDVRRAFRHRRFLVAAVGLNFVINPVLAWVLAEVFLGGRPALATGLILFLVTPCIGWYLVFTGLARGDTTLGVSVLGVNVALQVILLPFYLTVLAGESSSVPLTVVARSVALFLLLPGLLAALTRRVGSAPRAPARWLQPALLAVVIVSMFASESEVVGDNLDVVGRVAPPMIVFFLVTFGLALGVGHLLRLAYPQTALLCFTTTSRNSEASLAIAATAFADPLVGLVVVLGPIIELPLLVLMVRVLRRAEARRATTSDAAAQPAGV